MTICARYRDHSRSKGIRVRDVVEVLDIDEYLALAPTSRRQVDTLLDVVGTRPLSEPDLRTLIQVFGEESATGQAVTDLVGGGL